MLVVASGADELVWIERSANVSRFNVIISVGGLVVPFAPSICKGTNLYQRRDGRADSGAVRFLIGAAVKVAHYHFANFFPVDNMVDRRQTRHLGATEAIRSGGTGIPTSLSSRVVPCCELFPQRRGAWFRITGARNLRPENRVLGSSLHAVLLVQQAIRHLPRE
jgi:hypothetical protein